jgi:hypothetical protein
MTTSAATLVERLELADALLAGRNAMLEPQDLPGRYGRVVQALDRVLAACDCESVVGGGWAVWRHGYIGRVTQDIDVVLPNAKLAEFLQIASVSGFDMINVPTGNWPKLTHRATGIDVDILPEGSRPGTATRPAPSTIAHPSVMGAERGRLKYMSLAALVELKLAAGRLRDEADVVELLRENPDQIEQLRIHLASVHPQYADRLAELIERSHEELS